MSRVRVPVPPYKSFLLHMCKNISFGLHFLAQTKGQKTRNKTCSYIVHFYDICTNIEINSCKNDARRGISTADNRHNRQCYLLFSTDFSIRLIPLLLLAGGAFVGIIAVIALLCFHTTVSRMRFVGIICDIFLISMYASPLSIIYQVWRTKSVEFLPFWVCLAGFCNNICWLTYGFLKEFDLYIVIGSVVGAVFGFIQLCIYFYYAPKVKGSNTDTIPQV
ncbi:hypothetical protein ACS0TY_028865 [Phlomoides rotata]